MKCKKLVRAIIAFAVAGSMSMTVNATSISDLKDQKDQKESKKEEAEAVLAQLEKEQNSILDAIAELDAQVTEYTNEITDLEAQQTQLEADIETKQTELTAAQEKEQEQYEAMKERIKYSYENGNPSYLDVLFSTSDISDIVNQAEYADQIYSYDKNMFDDLVETRQTIADTKAGLEKDLKDVEDIKLEVEDNKAAVEVMIEGKQVQVANYESSIGDYEATIAELEQDIEATNQAYHIYRWKPAVASINWRNGYFQIWTERESWRYWFEISSGIGYWMSDRNTDCSMRGWNGNCGVLFKLDG